MSKYEISKKMIERLERNSRYHQPKDDQALRYVDIRVKARDFAYLIAENTPPSREQSIALTHLEDVVMWANAAIARNE